MGVYIPGGDKSSSSSFPSLPSSKSTSGSSLTIDGVTYYPRPSIGLSAWGLLKPSPDNTLAISLLLSAQTVLGISFIRHVRSHWRQTGWFSKVFHGGLGSWLVYQTGLGLSASILPWDPWVEEAKISRANLSEDEKGTWKGWWFGDLTYKFSSLNDWENKIGHWIEVTDEMESEYVKICDEFHKVSIKIELLEKVRDSKILEELNLLGNDWKFAKLPQHQEKSQFSSTSDLITKKSGPDVPIELDRLIQDEDSLILDEIRELNNPWVSLKDDTEYVIRFVPKFRWLQDRTEFTEARIKEAEEQQITQIRDKGESKDAI